MKHLLIALVILASSTSVYAKIYLPRNDANTEIMVIPGAEDDLYIKHQILQSANHTIEMISHLQTLGPVGGLVVDDLRKAMARGVKVKYLFEAVATMTGGGEFGLDSIPYLTDDRIYKRSQSELLVNRVTQRWNSPFAFNDVIHKKVLIVDRGTPNEKIIVTGRNNHEVNFKWSDLTFVIRRVDRNKPYIGDDIKEDFDKTWKFLRQYFEVEEPTVLNEKDKEKYEKIGFRPLRISKIGREINEILEREPKVGENLADYQFRPESVRMVTTDTMEQIVAKKLEKTLGVRPEIVDDVDNYLAFLLASATKIEANIYAMFIPNKIRNALAALVERNGEVTILTNSSESLGSALPVKTLTDAIASYSADMLAFLISKQPDIKVDKVKMFAMVPAVVSNYVTGPTATHRKMWVLEFPNGRKLSYFGSHNLTTASSSKSDELMIAAYDNRMADYFTGLNHQDLAIQYKRVNPDEVKNRTTTIDVARRVGRGLFQSIY